jgi:hypothetical protein
VKIETLLSNIADVLYVHEWEITHCKCGWKPNGDFDHVDHLAKMLTVDFDITRKATS